MYDWTPNRTPPKFPTKIEKGGFTDVDTGAKYAQVKSSGDSPGVLFTSHIKPCIVLCLTAGAAPHARVAMIHFTNAELLANIRHAVEAADAVMAQLPDKAGLRVAVCTSGFYDGEVVREKWLVGPVTAFLERHGVPEGNMKWFVTPNGCCAVSLADGFGVP